MHIDPGLVNVTQPATVNPQQTLQQANIHPVQAIIPQAHTQYFPMYHSSRPMDASVPASDPPHHHQWQQDENHGIAPQQTHIIHSVQTVHPHAERNTVPYREDTWDGYNHPTHHTPTTDALDSNAQPAHPAYDFRDSWEGAYYDHTNTVHARTHVSETICNLTLCSMNNLTTIRPTSILLHLLHPQPRHRCHRFKRMHQPCRSVVGNEVMCQYVTSRLV